ncbi:Hpt domain-containing protein [Salipiger marinus]|uniref:Hpt domain-containing protein n=1 Tax=Salipiger marinus TaxID=555512 RepID=A0A1G8NHY5_9RHOB|nr:Hpt domain-containing protein [Salipiger marinus]SDI79120.1 Hpt domain-containing protein [Salipiger marinus]
MIDWHRVTELRREIGPDDFEEVVQLFMTEVEATLAQLPLLQAQPESLAAALHFLKGSALNLGFRALSELCSTGEQAAAAAMAVDVPEILAAYARSKAHFLTDLPQHLAA